jgi:hypothetical protein
LSDPWDQATRWLAEAADDEGSVPRTISEDDPEPRELGVPIDQAIEEHIAGAVDVTLTVCANLLEGKEPEPIAEALRDMPEDPAAAYDVPGYARSNWSTRPLEHPGAKEVKPTPE